MLHSRYQAVLEGFKRAVVTSPGHSFLLLRPFRARQWLRAQGFDPSTPLGECDHIVPLWEGGTDDEDNLQLLCRPCHKAKTREEAVRKARMPKHHTAIADYEGSRG